MGRGNVVEAAKSAGRAVARAIEHAIRGHRSVFEVRRAASPGCLEKLSEPGRRKIHAWRTLELWHTGIVAKSRRKT